MMLEEGPAPSSPGGCASAPSPGEGTVWDADVGAAGEAGVPLRGQPLFAREKQACGWHGGRSRHVVSGGCGLRIMMDFVGPCLLRGVTRSQWCPVRRWALLRGCCSSASCFSDDSAVLSPGCLCWCAQEGRPGSHRFKRDLSSKTLSGPRM